MIMHSAGPGLADGALLERDQSLDMLVELLGEVRASSEGRLVLVGGEAGAGKIFLASPSHPFTRGQQPWGNEWGELFP